jgi:hypothetical protein
LTKKWWAKLSLVLVSVLVGLLLAEIVLRVVGFTYPVFYTTDERRGYALRAGVEGWYRKEGEAFVRINSAGLRDREHAREKPPRTLRVAVLGDSYAEALQVPVEDAFWSVLERELGACESSGGRQVEVINFGVSGYGTAQQLITLREHVWQYAPDIVLLAVTTNNDIVDNSRALKKTDEIPYYLLRGGRLTLDDSFLRTRAFRLRNSALNRFGRWIRDNSRVIQAIHQAQGALKARLAARRAAKPQATPTPVPRPSAAPGPSQKGPTGASPAADAPAVAAVTSEELGVDNWVYRQPEGAVWNDAWSVTEELLKAMRDEVQGKGALFFVATLSNGIQVYPEPSARAAFMQRVRIQDLFYPDRRIKSLGEREGFRVVNLAPALQEYAERNRVFLHGFGEQTGNGHWNSEGHRVAGQMLARELCQEK